MHFWLKKDRKSPYEGVTYKEFYKDVEGLGTAFLRMELAGKKIAVIGQNRYEWAVTYLAAANGESMIVPIDKELPYEDWAHLLDISDVTTVVYSGKILPKNMVKAREEKQKLRFFWLIWIWTTTPNRKSAFKKLLASGKMMVKRGRQELLQTLKSIPTRRKFCFSHQEQPPFQRACFLSHKNICAALMGMCTMAYIGPGDIFLSILPLHHTYECNCGFLAPLYRGCTIAHCDGLKYIAKNLAESKATVMLCVPAVIEAMYKRIWSAAKKNGIDQKLKKGIKLSNSLRKVHIDMRRKIFKQIHDNFGGHFRMFVVGAAAPNPEVSKGLRDFGFLVIQGYGITECSPIVALNRDTNFRDDAAGQAMPNIAIDVVDKNSEGIGEIVCKGPNVMLGYYQNKEATDEVIVDGWFHTGDLGYIDDEGFCHITGRKKSVIVTQNGKNIFPEELEIFLSTKTSIFWKVWFYGEYNPEDGETLSFAR
ncbi:MAG: AMP-binding protein [Clostridiales bacterium]|nr:MAG: AMP-binding protein [Clostridiales bacterium]